MNKKLAPIAAGVLMLILILFCIFSIVESKGGSSYQVTRSMEIAQKKLEITAYVERKQMTKEDLDSCVDGALSLCRDYLNDYFDEESTQSELGKMLNRQRNGESGPYELSSSPTLLLNAGLALTDFSGGAYDVTAGALYRLYADPEAEPTQSEIAKALATCGTGKITVSDDGVRLADGVIPDLRILTDAYLCRVLEEYFVLSGISNVCVQYGDVVFVTGGKLVSKGFLFGRHIEIEPFEVVFPDAYPDLKEDRFAAKDGYYSWVARPEAVRANANYIDEIPLVSSKDGMPIEHDIGSVAVAVKNGAHAWYAHAIARMLLSMGRESAINLLKSELLETTFGLELEYVRFETVSGETEYFGIEKE